MGMCSTVERVEILGYRENDHLHQILWLVRLNSATLIHLELKYMHLNTPRVVRDVCRTISQLHHLQALRVSIESIKLLLTHGGWATLETSFLSCPASLFKLKVGHWEEILPPISYDGDDALDPIVGDWDFDQGPLVLREGENTPLHGLKRFSIPCVIKDDSWVSTLWSILKHSSGGDGKVEVNFL